MVIPKLSTPAGFPIGTGIFINPMRPEEAAGMLRDAVAAEIVK